MSVPITPLAGYVVAVAEEAESKTISGLYLPEAAKEKPKTVKVVAVGTKVEGIKTGDRIIYKNSYEATDIKVGKEEFVIIFWQNIIAVVK
jgi:chaperonin GroES